MVVECEQCKTKFRFDLRSIKGSQAKVRCSRCGNIFEVAKPEPVDGILSEFPVEKPVVRQDDIVPAPAITGRISPTIKRKKRKLGSFLVRLIVLVVLGAVLLVLAKFGYDLLKDSISSDVKVEKPSVMISDTVQAYFLENAHAGQIFVVEGETFNDFSKPISFVLLEGEVYNTDNEVVRSQQCFAGNPLSREELTNLTIDEIRNRMMNKEGKDLINVHIPPQGRVAFVIVYHNLPNLEMLTDYSVEVVSFEVD
jgi:predicted Zn finger-like uncharacterized protein